MTRPMMIEANKLSKSFDGRPAVVDLDWNVATGSISGIVGPNGAGKTTIAKMLLGMTRPTSGTGTVLGYQVGSDSLAIRRRASFVPEDKLLYDDMRVHAFLRFYGSYFSEWDGAAAARLLDAWKIPGGARIKALSKGMRAKLVLAAALARQARVLFLDEPTIDLDPVSAEEILLLLVQWVGGGERSVVIITHRLEEVERICDSVLVIEDGRSLLRGDLDDTRADWKRLRIAGEIPDTVVSGLEGVHSVQPTDAGTTIVMSHSAAEAVAAARAAGTSQVEVQDMNLREIYLALTHNMRGRLDDAVEGLV